MIEGRGLKQLYKILKIKLSMDLLPINIGVGEDISIKMLAEKIKRMIKKTFSEQIRIK